MKFLNRQNIELVEYSPVILPKDAISPDLAVTLWRSFGEQVLVEFPSPKTGGMWQFTSQGWVGFIPLSSEVGFWLQPKVPLENLFGMWEYAYRLKGFRFLEGLTGSDSLREFYENLALILAKRILDRGRRGFYRSYLGRFEQLQFIRGRLDLAQLMRQPWLPRFECQFDEHTGNIEENQILVWTVMRIVASGACSDRTLPTIRQTYHVLEGLAMAKPFTPNECTRRTYNRLNHDYEPLHALCRFFLEQSGPAHHSGDRKMIPFLVDMSRLYELFVAEWLRANLPSNFLVKPQQEIVLDSTDRLGFKADLIVYETPSMKPVFVLDTKYKRTSSPNPDDIAQVVAYAQAIDCNEAVLIYPTSKITSRDMRVGATDTIRVRSLSFALDTDLEEAGRSFMGQLMEAV